MALTLASSGQGGVFTVRAGSFGGRLQAGVTPAAPSLLLDIYPDAAAAYSLRKLRTAYTGSAIRVRRSSDNTETDIGFVSNQLDTAAITTFVGAGNGFVTIWYDQSGNSQNQIQNTAGNQPQLVANGSVILLNTKPSFNINIAGTSTSQFMSTSTALFNSIQTTIIAVNRSTFLGPAGIFQRLVSIGAFNSGYYLGGNSFLDDMLAIFNGSAATCFGGTINVQNLSILYNNATTGFLNNNGNQVGTITTSVSSYGNQKLFIGSDSANNNQEYWKGNIQEVVVYPVNQSSNISGIQTNINSYYSIY
jgi:hypothetical protein